MLKNWIGAVALTAAAVFVAYPSGDEPPETAIDAPRGLHADIHVLKPVSTHVSVQGYGQLQPKWTSRLAAETGGRVVSVSSKLRTGSRFRQGEVLAVIEDTAYRSAAASAKSALAAAERLLLEEEQRARLALENWKASGLNGEPSALTLRQPQLAEARASAEAALAALVRAEYELAQTRIRAPYDGVVASRNLSPGDVVQAGSQAAEIYDTSFFEAAIPLSAAAMAQLGDPVGAKAELTDSLGRSWSAESVRVEPAVDAENRWINLVVRVQGSSALMPGQFVTAVLQGRRLEAVFAVPEDLVSKRGRIWVLDSGNRLRAVPAAPVFTADGVHYILPPDGMSGRLRVAVPRSGFLEGAQAEPRVLAEPRPDAALRAELPAAGVRK